MRPNTKRNTNRTDKIGIWIVSGATVVFIAIILFLLLSLRKQSIQNLRLQAEQKATQLVEESTKAKMNDLAKQNQYLQSRVASLTPENGNLKKQINDLQPKVASLTAENSNLKKQIADLESRVVFLTKDNGLKKQKVGQSKSDVQKSEVPAPPVKKEIQTKPLVKFNIKGKRIGDIIANPVETDSFIIHDKEVNINYCFKGNKLIGVNISFSSDLFADIVKVFTDKFGCRPDEYQRREVKANKGAKYVNEIVRWRTDCGDFVVRKYSDRLDRGFGLLLNPEMLEDLSNKQNQELKKHF
jgi:hypothetical protein